VLGILHWGGCECERQKKKMSVAMPK